MITVHYTKLGTVRRCECDNYTQMLNFIGLLKKRMRWRSMQPCTVEAYTPMGEMIYQYVPTQH